MMFAFAVSLFGILIAIRIAKFLIVRDLFTRNEMTKIGTAYVIAVVILISFLPKTRLTLWFSTFLPMLSTAFIGFVILKKRANAFREKFRETLTHLILKMKSGSSFRQALAEVTSNSETSVRTKLTAIGNVVAFSQQNSIFQRDDFVEEVIGEFVQADRQPHAAIQRLSVFREKLRIEDDFRHRSGQVLSQIRAQSIIMSGLYIAVFAFVISQFGWRGNQSIIGSSGFLFSMGAVWVWIGGRKIRWRV